MKVSKEQTSQNRAGILEAAAQLYRQQGFKGVGVADITRAAGLTHGGLYRHFESKEDLAAQACARSFEWSLAELSPPGQPVDLSPAAVAALYLTPAHRDAAGTGCPVAALANDVARTGGKVADAFVAGVERYLTAFAQHRPDGSTTDSSTPADRARAIELVTQLVGALVMARATAPANAPLSDEILRTVAQAIARQHTPAPGPAADTAP
jgi:TetR/AcrR family transcriptional repressor of nem operon